MRRQRDAFKVAWTACSTVLDRANADLETERKASAKVRARLATERDEKKELARRHKVTLDIADKTLSNCYASLISYDTALRQPTNQALTYQLGRNLNGLLKSIQATREAIEKEVRS